MTGTLRTAIVVSWVFSACHARESPPQPTASSEPSATARPKGGTGAGGCSGDGECLPGYCDDKVCRAFRTEEEPCSPSRRCATGLTCMPFPEPTDAERGLCVLEVAYADVSAKPEQFLGHLIGFRDVALLAGIGGCLAKLTNSPGCGCGPGPMILSETGRYVAPARRIVVAKYSCQWFGCYPKCPVPSGKRYRIAGRLGGRDGLTGLPNRVLTIAGIQMLEEAGEPAKR